MDLEIALSIIVNILIVFNKISCAQLGYAIAVAPESGLDVNRGAKEIGGGRVKHQKSACDFICPAMH